MKLERASPRQWMAALASPLNRWLRGRSARERALLIVASVAVAVWASWMVVFSPVQAWRETTEREAGAWERRLEWLKTQPRSQARSELRPGLLTSAIGDCGLKLLRVNQEGAAILVTLQDQSFACVLDWLFTVEREHAIEVEQLRLQSGQRQGSVSGTLRFSG